MTSSAKKMGLYLALSAITLLVACPRATEQTPTSGRSGKGAGEPAGEETRGGEHRHQPQEADKHEGTPGGQGEHGHEHGNGAEGSDLDRPLAELFGARCEHEIKTFQCAECRYEVGVVKASGSLFSGGLLKTSKVARTAVAAPLSLTGEIRFDDRRVAHVSTLAEGIIRRVHVTLGDKVKRGQPLLELESVTVGESQAAYLEQLGLLKLAQRNHDRIEALRQESISSQKEQLEAHQQLEAAKIRTEAALGKLTRIGMTAASARALRQATARGRLVLRAPADGTVLEMHAVAGEVARSETSLVTVGDNSSLWVWADLYERDMALVTRAQASSPLSTELTVKAFPGVPFSGVVDFVSPSMSMPSRTVKLRIVVPNPDGRLLAGMFASVKVFVPGDQQALTTPRGAVLEDEGRPFVFVHHHDDFYVRRPVSTGRSFAGLVEITAGLTGEEVVVTDGAFLLKSDVLRSKMGAGCAD